MCIRDSPAPTSSAQKTEFVPRLTPNQAQQKRAHTKDLKEREKAALKAATLHYQRVRCGQAPQESAAKVAARFGAEHGVVLQGHRVWENSVEGKAGCSPKPRGFKSQIPQSIVAGSEQGVKSA
eukprot:TRINITY_DN18235_c0_g1_i1.p1 TRINITY_DN18235_c0_g1~~TRINITY_DN18235_c0_g1_i1.p1  ORF type:complete len:123 (-),score=37.69 TRINITY_DN18235_c0_g1_i1:109-477(-)